MSLDSETTKTTQLESVDSLDGVADLLFGESDFDVKEKQEEQDEEEQDQEDDSVSSDDENEASTDDSSESNDPETWANALGVDDSAIVLDEEGNFAGVNIKIDGETDTVDLKTLINGYQFNKYNTQKAQQLAEQKRQFEELHEKASTAYIEKLNNADKLVKHMHNSLLGEFEKVDWQTLRAQNPGEYAALVEDFKTRQAELEQIFSAVDSEKQSISTEQQQKQRQQIESYFKQQAEYALLKNPEWKDPQRLEADMNKFMSFVKESYGFSEQEFASVQDARLYELVKDAYAYRNGVKDVQSKKLDKPLPKFQKSTGKVVKSSTKLDKLIKRAKSSSGYSSKHAQTDAIAELLMSGG